MLSCRLIALGGQNDQNLEKAGVEANLDAQFVMGLTHPTPAVYYSTAGSPPFNPDAITVNNTNEPYSYVRHCFFLSRISKTRNKLVVATHAFL